MEENKAQDEANPESVKLIVAGLNGAAASTDVKPKEPAGKDASKPAPAAPIAAEKPAAAGALTPTEELLALRERLAQVEERESAFQAQRQAISATDDFIRDRCVGVPGELARKFLPVTADKAVLERDGQKLNALLSEYVKSEVKAGRIQYVNIGGSAGGRAPGSFGGGGGGMPVTALPPMEEKNPAKMIAAGLQNRRR